MDQISFEIGASRTRRRTWFTLALAGLIVIVYWPSWSLPLSFDDAWSVRLTASFSLTEIFTNTQNFGYFRPLYLAYYRLAAALGGSGAWVLHALCVLTHAANAALVFGLVRSVIAHRHSEQIAAGAALLFAFNPFAVQAVALPAGLNHLLALLFAQLALLCYIELRDGAAQRLGWWLGCLCFCLLSFLSNEIGLSVAGFALWVELARAWRVGRWTRAAWSFAVVTGFAGAYAVLYQFIPKGEATALVFSSQDVLHRALISLQTWVYPFAFLAGLMDWPAQPVIILSAVLVFMVGALLARRYGYMPIVLGFLWFVFASALPIIRLSADYVENAPRVFYLSAVGTAMTWSSLACLINHRPLLRRFAAAGMAVVGGIGIWHVSAHQFWLVRAHEPVQAIAEHGAQIELQDELAVINMPEWIAVPRRRFPLFSEGAIVMASYVRGSDLVLANAGFSRTVHLLTQAIPSEHLPPYAFQTFGSPVSVAQLLASARVLQTQYLDDGPSTAWIGGTTKRSHEPAQAHFGDDLALVHALVQPCRDGWIVTLRWQRIGLRRPLAQTLSASVQATDAQDAKLAQADGAPMNKLLPFADLPIDRDVLDRRVLSAQRVAPATLRIGVYDYVSGVRLPARDALGRPLAGDTWTISLPTMDARVPCR